MLRPCLDCGRPTPKPRCPTCAQRSRHSKSNRYNPAWKRYSREVRANWLATKGPWCPGYGRPGHWVDPSTLTVDHGPPASVMCRSCNSRKGATADAAAAVRRRMGR